MSSWTLTVPFAIIGPTSLWKSPMRFQWFEMIKPFTLKKFTRIVRQILGAVRVIVGPLIGFGLIKFLNLNGFAAGVLLIQTCMPSAVLTYLVGSMYSEKKVVDSVASVIVTSTTMSFVTIPIVVYYSLKY